MSKQIEHKFLTISNGLELINYQMEPGESFFSNEIPLSVFEPNGLFTLFADVSEGGGGFLTVAIYGSLTGLDADYAPVADYAPLDSFEATGGLDNDGKVNAPVVLSVCKKVKFKISNPHETESLIIRKLVFGWQ